MRKFWMNFEDMWYTEKKYAKSNRLNFKLLK